jgi:spore coat polysaccharide biosynthesis protein SpsF
MDKFGIVIQCRLNSKRFPKKILKPVFKKKSILEFLINRLTKVFPSKKIIIASAENHPKIIEISKKNKTNLFVGSEKNVLKRYYDAANKYKLKYIIRLTSDCPLIDPKTIMDMIKEFKKHNIDYIANTLPPKNNMWPDGSDVEILTMKCLTRVYREAKKKEDKEHVTNFIWKNQKKFKTKVFKINKDYSNFKFSVDYKDDLEVVKKILKVLKTKNQFGTIKQICSILMRNNDLKLIMKKNKDKFLSNRKDLV